MKMKRIILALTMLVAMVTSASAQAEIKFEKVVHDFGTFEETSPVQKATFTFTNVGNKPLVINQAIASCGCTVPSYTKQPIAPGQKGQISVTYNGRGMFPGHFKKSITIRTNDILFLRNRKYQVGGVETGVGYSRRPDFHRSLHEG